MSAIDTVNRELREFKRYTGDGLPGEPVNAPLPVGDPQSGVHNPKKVNLRKAMLAPLEEAAQSASDAKDEADRAEQEADRAENAASSFIEVATNFKTVAALQADETMGYAGSGKAVIVGEGDVVTAQGFRYEVVAGGATDAHVETAGGVKLYETLPFVSQQDRLARLPGSPGQTAVVTHPQDPGIFSWSGNDCADVVSRDPSGNFAVPLASDPSGASGAWLRRDGTVYQSVTYRIPTDYSTLQEAVDDLRRYNVLSNVKVTLLIESGYVIPLTEPKAGLPDSSYVACLCMDGDYSHITVEAEDAVVEVAASFEGAVFRNIRANGIRLNCLVDMLGKGNIGYSVESSGSGYVLPYAGVINSGGIGLWARQTVTLHATALGGEEGGVNFSGAATRGCYISHGARGFVRRGNFSGSGVGVEVSYPSSVDAADCDLTDCDIGAYAEYGGIMNIRGSNLEGCRKAIHAGFTSSIEASGTNLNGCEELPVVLATDSSTVNLRNASCTSIMADGTEGLIVADHGSNINCHNVSAAKWSGAQGTSLAFVVRRGSTINGSGSTGTRVADNTLTADGVFYK